MERRVSKIIVDQYTHQGNGENVGSKALRLLSLLPVRPLEFCDRVSAVLEVRSERLFNQTPTYSLIDWQVLLEQIEQKLGVPVKPFMLEPAFSEIEGAIEAGIAELRTRAPFRLSHNADYSLARLYYLVCRALRPDVVLETGVGYGVSSAYILKALENNGGGVLHSIDLPPLGHKADDFVGFLVPEPLKHRWQLHRGVSKRILPPLLRQMSRVDVFIHDSLHTNANVRRELCAVSPLLAPRSVVVADDVHENNAFRDWATKSKPAFWAAVREDKKESTFGVCVFNEGKECGPVASASSRAKHK
jgi:predicted O-methyltransferase YrrM